MLRNITRNMTLAERPNLALSFWQRGVGMIGKSFNDFDALIIPRCRAIHTWFMSQPLDLIFVDREKKVLGLEVAIKPWRVIAGPPSTHDVIELPPHKLCGNLVECNDVLEW